MVLAIVGLLIALDIFGGGGDNEGSPSVAVSPTRTPTPFTDAPPKAHRHDDGRRTQFNSDSCLHADTIRHPDSEANGDSYSYTCSTQHTP